MKLKIDDEIDEKLNIILRNTFKLQKIRGVFKVKILLIVYIEFFIKNKFDKVKSSNDKILEVIRFITDEKNEQSIDPIFEFIKNLNSHN